MPGDEHRAAAEDILDQPGSRSAGTRAHRSASRSFAELERGEKALDDYLKERLQRAIAPLRGLLPESDLRCIEAVVKNGFMTDPVLSALIARIAASTAAATAGAQHGSERTPKRRD